MAQWITRLPTEQKIPGSNPGTLRIFLASDLRLIPRENAWFRVHFHEKCGKNGNFQLTNYNFLLKFFHFAEH